MFKVSVVDRESGTILYGCDDFTFLIINGTTTIEDVKREVLDVAAAEGNIKSDEFQKYEVLVNPII